MSAPPGAGWKVKYSLRAWQQTASQKWRDKRKGVVSVVTGGGKTVFAETCLAEFFDAHPDGLAVIIVPTSALLDQWYLSLQDELGVEKEAIGVLGSGERPHEDAKIVIAVINSARRVAGKWAQDGRPVMLVVDECHRAGSPENAKALEGVFLATLGLSATPVREYDDGFAAYIEPALGPVIYEYTYVEAYADGVITPFELHNVRVAMLEDEQDKYDRLNKRVRTAFARGASADDDESLRRLLQQRAAVSGTALMRIPVAVKLIEDHRGERAIIFHERTDAADHILKLLQQRGHSATVYHAGLAPALRRENLRLFRRGVFDVLVCCRALDEGMNVPETSVAVIASSTASERQRIQRLGRILRPAKGKAAATVYTIFATNEEHDRLAAEADKLSGIAATIWHEGRAAVRG
ncbi:DEAD/DEAH box helicase [Erythrobacteraceae bacterium CFH 75059]|uniref:DEAD/DEAH box helicase n=1 Tax=Qipengyuania thermophila TaxID=2509361 RepID=UPI001020A936|nr:DEAD/DEAH box helicase [Qipengyuania thermophila]TCD06649.1 DEAD/DEAH box helicase [Erythrobacteraceae bacterium CFH 75059]